MQHSLNWVQEDTHPWHGGSSCASLSSTERLHCWEGNLNRPEGEERERLKCLLHVFHPKQTKQRTYIHSSRTPDVQPRELLYYTAHYMYMYMYRLMCYLHAVDENSNGKNGIKETDKTRRRHRGGCIEGWVADHYAVWKTETWRYKTHHMCT